MNLDMFVFSMIYVARRDDPYYYTRWDLAKPVEVVAETEQAAINKAAKMLGDAGSHHHWVFRVKSIRDALEFDLWLADHEAEVLPAAGVTQPEPKYEYTTADYDGTPNNQRFYVYGSVPARIAKYRRVKAGDWEVWRT